MYTIDEKGCLTSYEDDIPNGTLTIPNEVISIGQFCFESRTDIKKIVIPEGVTAIERSAFDGCTSLEDIMFPRSLQEIHDFAFTGCSSLQKIKIHDGLIFLGFGAFYNCTDLEELDLPAEIPHLHGMPFESTKWVIDQSDDFICICEKRQLVKCTLPPDTKYIDVPEGIRVIEGACFNGIEDIININIPASVESISSFAWYSLTNLEKITVHPDNKYYAAKDNVLFSKDMTELIAYPLKRGGAFYAVPGGVQRIGIQAFNESSLERLVLSRSVEELGEECFCGMKNIKELYIPERIRSIGAGAFTDCRSLSKITVSPRNKYFADSDGILFTKNKKTLVFVPNGSGHIHYAIPKGVKRLEECAINGHQTIKTVSMPQSLKEIGSRAFGSCIALESLNIPDSVTKLGSHICEYSEQLKTMRLPKAVKEMPNGEFEDCRQLETVFFPRGLQNIGRFLFKNCDSIREVYLGQLRLITDNQELEGVDIRSVKQLHRRGECMDIVPHGIFACVTADAYINHGRNFARDYIKEYTEKIFEYFINTDEKQIVKKLTDSGDFLNSDNIYKICEIAVKHTQETGNPEIQVYLTQYRHAHFGGEFDELKL